MCSTCNLARESLEETQRKVTGTLKDQEDIQVFVSQQEKALRRQRERKKDEDASERERKRERLIKEAIGM